MKHLVASLAFILLGCGGPLSPGAGDDPGSGTRTLEVRGRVSAEPRFANAMLATEFETEIGVRVFLNGVQVTTGDVTVSSEHAVAPLAWSPDIDGGEWHGRLPAYDEVYQLDVVSGPDELLGVIVDGPDIHTFIEPLAGATLDSTLPNDLAWKRDEVADVTTFDAEEIDRITITDSGLFTMSAGMLKADADQARTNRLQLRRMNMVVPAGAIGDSSFAVSIENRLDVIVAPNPAL